MNNHIVKYQEINTPRGTLRGLLIIPTGEIKNLVVMFHGYTGHKNENGYLFKQISLEIVKYGYASLRFDFMGSGDSDGEFKDMTFLTEIEDAKEILEYAKMLNNQKPFILLGFSFGGAISAYLSSRYQDYLEKLILLSPAGNMNILAEHTFTLNHVDENGNVDLGGYYLNKAFYESFKGIDLYDGVTTFNKPVLICHGSDDMSVPVEFGRKYHELYPHNIFFEINGSPHCYTKVPFREEVRKHIVEFLTK